MTLVVEVRGTPVPQGALVRSPHGGLYHRGRGALEDWRQAIATEARAIVADEPLLEGPVAVRVEFRIARPKAHWLPPNLRRPRPELRVDAPYWHHQAPDADKLARAALDALTGVVWLDDRQVARLVVVKRWSAVPGAEIRIRPLEMTP